MNLDQFVGQKRKVETTVKESQTAAAVGSGSIAVFSTPNMIGLMESAALDLVQPLLDEGYTTVGTSVNIVHLAATPIGIKITAEAELVQVDGKKLEFKVIVWDEKEKIGEGMHERFIVSSTRFMEKVHNKYV